MRYLVLCTTFLAFSAPMLWAGQEGTEQAQRREEAEDYFRKWLDEDVVYIISDEERSVFEKLTTPEEKEQFIEQFWFRRDPNPGSAENEFKEEHYRRIAYANERFSSGRPGWMTDRGRIYIIHGPPAEVEAHPSGGYYQRPMSEGGGQTVTYPFEVWRYRNIEGIGTGIMIEFVDPSMSGEYKLALRPEEKDAMLFVPGAGQTLAEELGLAKKSDRPYFSGGNRDRYPLMHTGANDNPFQRYETYALVQRPPSLKYNDLKEMVDVHVSFSSLPVQVQEDYFRLNDQQVLVPVTLMLKNKDLAFKQEGDLRVARVAVYGLVTSLTNRIVAEFEDDLVTSLNPNELEAGLNRSSVYQKVLPVESKMRYKLDLVVKDMNGGQVGVIRRAIMPPRIAKDGLFASSLLISSYVKPLDTIPEADEMFVLGDVKIRPNLSKRFSPEQPFGVYFHLYNVHLDQSSLTPSLELTYRFRKDGVLVQSVDDRNGESTQFFSGQRVVIVKMLSLKGLEPGKYRIEIEATDHVSEQKVMLSDSFVLE